MCRGRWHLDGLRQLKQPSRRRQVISLEQQTRPIAGGRDDERPDEGLLRVGREGALTEIGHSLDEMVEL